MEAEPPTELQLLIAAITMLDMSARVALFAWAINKSDTPTEAQRSIERMLAGLVRGRQANRGA